MTVTLETLLGILVGEHPDGCGCGTVDDAITTALKLVSKDIEMDFKNEGHSCMLWRTNVSAAYDTLMQNLRADNVSKRRSVDHDNQEQLELFLQDCAQAELGQRTAIYAALDKRQDEMNLAYQGKYNGFVASESTKPN